MEMEKQIKIRLYILLIGGIGSIGFGMYNLTKGGESDMFAIMNFGVGLLFLFFYIRMKKRFFPNTEKPWRSYR